MSSIIDYSIKIKNYKCFGDEPQGIDDIRPINVIIGKNNSGKSALLDVLQFKDNLLDYPNKSLWRGATQPEIFLSKELYKSDIQVVIPPDNQTLLSLYSKKRLTCKIKQKGKCNFYSLDPDLPRADANLENLSSGLFKNWEKAIFRRLAADRDVFPEKDKGRDEWKRSLKSESKVMDKNGAGITNAIQHYINDNDLNSTLVEIELLNELNKIYKPDSDFKRITVQRSHDEWEIYLHEEKKGAIPVSHTGSGFKTVLLILANLYLIPAIEGKGIDEYVFGFEEIENNLHPDLQRRLLSYLREFALSKKCIFFITTHSPVVIDHFYGDDCSQIIHVTHDGENSYTRTVESYTDSRMILDDLGARASDLLQSNGIIWVEGPSDIIYINKWIELFSNGKIKPGIHYQCFYYSGDLRSHLSLKNPDEDVEQLVNLLQVNRNAIIVVDSDKKSKNDAINENKKRVLKEVEENGGIGWLTEGREIENYISKEFFGDYYNTEVSKSFDRYEIIGEYLNQIEPGEGDKYRGDKVNFAKKYTQKMTKENIGSMLDLEGKILSICRMIEKWNGM